MRVYGKKIYRIYYDGGYHYHRFDDPIYRGSDMEGCYNIGDVNFCGWERSEQVYTAEADKWTGGIDYAYSRQSTLERLLCDSKLQQSKWGGHNRCRL